MRKTAFVLGVALVAVFTTMSCDPPEGDPPGDLDTPNVTYVAINYGGQLRLTWAPVTDAEGYRVQTDDSTFTTTGTTFDLTTPTKTISVLAYSDTIESKEWSKNLSAVITATLDVYGMSDPSPDHPSGLGFDTAGTCIAYSLDSVNYLLLDFYMDDQVQPQQMYFFGPNRYSPPFNDKDNTVSEASGTDFDAAMSAAGGDFLSFRHCGEDTVYYIWLDPSANGWDAVEDHFGKVKVLSIQGTKVTMKLALQTVPGLGWVRTD